jgi:CheY-like chemotaxis protein
MITLNGPEASKHVRQLGYGGSIIAVTGNVLEKDVRAFEEAGANIVLRKPMDFDKLKMPFCRRYTIFVHIYRMELREILKLHNFISYYMYKIIYGFFKNNFKKL